MTCRVLAKEKTTTFSAFLMNLMTFVFLHDRNRATLWELHGSCTASDGLRVFDLIDKDMIHILLDTLVDLVVLDVRADAQVNTPYRSTLISLLLICGYGMPSFRD